MTTMRTNMWVGRAARVAALGMALIGAAGSAWAADEPQDSRRMSNAKDFIADEQWTRAIAELRSAVADPKERNKDEALFWMAHSQNQAGDLAAAVESIRTLEREYGKSRWVHPGRSLLIELAQKLRRDDFLWWTATPHPPRAVPFPATPLPDAHVRPPELPTPAAAAPTPPPTMRPPGAAQKLPPPRKPARSLTPPAAADPPPPFYYVPDADLRIQALSSLIHTDGERAIPMLKNIALERNDTVASRRAVFVLAQSRMPKAHSAVIEVAKTGPEPVQIAAVRELARFGDPNVSQALLQVYSTAKAPVKREVVRSLGGRAEVAALVRIADSERDVELREVVVTSLGRAGGREPLQRLYFRDRGPLKRPIIVSLFNCRGEDELIKIAEEERNPALKNEAIRRLTLMGTPKAKAFVEKTRVKSGR